MSTTLVQETATRLPQNLLKYSDDLDNATWTMARMETEVYDATNDDWVHEPTTDTGAHYTGHTLLTTLGNSDYTLSVRLRYINHRWVMLRFYDGTDVYYQSVDLLNGALGVNLNITSESITEVSTDVYDVSFTCSAVAASSISNVVIGLQNTDTLALESWTPAGTEQIGVSRASLENYSTVGVYTKTTSDAIPGGNRVLTRLPQNLILQSNDFDTTWLLAGTAGITDNGDGSWTLDLPAVSDGIYQSVLNIGTGVWITKSIEMKVESGTETVTITDPQSGSNPVEQVTLTTEWQRFDVSGATAIAHCGIYIRRVAAGANPEDTATEVIMRNAQLETRPDGNPGTYTATTTAAVPGVTITRASTASYVDHNGIIQTAAIGEDRTDYDPSDNSLRGLLVEETRTNIQVNSEDFENALWAKGSDTSSDAANFDVVTAPDGTLTGDRLQDDNTGGTGSPSFFDGNTYATSTTYTLSVFAKADQLDWIFMRVVGLGALSISAYFDVANGAVGATTGADNTSENIEDFGNGWYRCSIVFESDAADTAGTTYINLANANNDTACDIDGTSSVYLWGAQLEAGSAPSSYIPTTTVSVTRAADVISITDLTQIGYSATAGSMLANWRHNEDFNSAQRPWSISDGTSNEQLHISRISAVAVRFSVTDGGALQCNFGANGTFPADQNILMATAWKLNDLAASVDGGAASNDTSATLPTVDQLWMGARYDGTANELNGHIAKLVYYPVRLYDVDLVQLSSGLDLYAGPQKLSIGINVGL